MSTNYNQLLKDLEIGSVYVKILICVTSTLPEFPVKAVPLTTLS